MKKALLLLGALTIMATSLTVPTAQAADCAPLAVDNIRVRGTGTVWATFAGQGIWEMCMLGATHKGVTAPACESMLSVLLAAHLSGRQVRVTTPDSTCSVGQNVYQISIVP